MYLKVILLGIICLLLSCGGLEGETPMSSIRKSSVQTKNHAIKIPAPISVTKPIVEQQRIAVLEIKNKSKELIKDEELVYLSNLVRQALERLPQDRFLMITQENIISSFSKEKSLDDCLKDCVIARAKTLGADYIISGDLLKVGDSIEITFKLYESKSGLLKANDRIVSQKNEALSDVLQGTIIGLFKELVPEMRRISDRLKKGFVYEKISLNDLLNTQVIQINKLTKIKGESIHVPAISQVELKGIHLGKVNVDVLVLYDQAVKADKNVKLDSTQKKIMWDLLLEKEQDSEIAKVAKNRSLAWENMILNEQYQAVINFDQGDATPQEKIKYWQDLKSKAPLYEKQANQRILEWQNWLKDIELNKNNLEKLYQDIIQLDQKRKQKRDEDWQKLSQLLKLEVISEEDKLNWIEAFIEAYGGYEKMNPYLKDIDHSYSNILKERTKEIFNENIAELKKKSELFSKFPINFWSSHPITILEDIPWDFLTGPLRDKIGLQKTKNIGIELILIKGGDFMMGRNDGLAFEKPMHMVKIKDFYISKTEVTVRQYRKCVEDGFCTKPNNNYDNQYCNWGYDDRENHPINCVDWTQARSFAKWVGGDLPSEAQWEYAARSGGKDIKYPWGNSEVSCEYAVIANEKGGCGHNSTWEVCKKPEGNTKQEVCDMGGNVWEWVLDEWHSSYQHAPNHEAAWCADLSCNLLNVKRVIRGGSWSSQSHYLSSTYRSDYAIDYRNLSLGFRVSDQIIE